MFKLIAIIGAVAGGATYGIYESGYLDRHGDCDGGACPLKVKSSCCADGLKANVSAEPCEGETLSCCSGKKTLAAKLSCCSEDDTTSLVSATVAEKVARVAAAGCVNPVLACVLAVGDEGNGDNAKAAVAGMAVVAAKVK